MEDEEAYYCHCRMCQKAFGNLFGAYFFELGESVRWESAEPAYFHSSNIARRGFCRECGTPLSFEYLGSEEIHLTVGSLEEPGRLGIEIHSITLLPIGGVSNLESLPEKPSDEVKITVAGPLVNVVLALLFFGVVFCWEPFLGYQPTYSRVLGRWANSSSI
jgi:hypothetical protein